MSRKKISYTVKIVDSPIELIDGKRYSRHAILEKWSNNYKLSSRKLGAPDKADIYEKIKNGEDLNLDNCFVKDFSISDYRKKFGIPENKEVILTSVSAQNAFFESIYGTDFSYTAFKGQPGNFSYAIFNQGKANFGHSRCESSLNFNRAEFHLEELSFRFAEFDKGDMRFSTCIFDCEDILFVNTNFGDGNVSFRQADFRKSNCNFQYARFAEGNISFDKAVFDGDHIDFRKVEFGKGKVEFRRVNFGNGNVSFNGSIFEEGKISFRYSFFGTGFNTFESIDFGENEVWFDDVISNGGYLSFKGSQFKTLSITDSRLHGHCNFKVAKGELIDLSFSIIKDILDFQSGEFHVNLKTLKIDGIKIMGKIFISWEENNVYHLISSQKMSSDQSKAEQFNLLKESFNSNGKYSSEDKAYVAFKRFEMKSKLKKSKLKGKLNYLKGHILYAIQWLVFDKAGLFATAPLRVFTTMIVVLSFFALVYMSISEIPGSGIYSSIGDPDSLTLVSKSFYHSAITFFTIGYGDFYPSGHARWISAVEGWAGVFLMSYFTVAFVRKILR